MNRMQKIAVFNVIVLVSSIVISSAIVVWIGVKEGYPFAFHGYGFLCLALLHLLSGAIFPKKKNELFDERDQYVQRQANFNGESVSNTFFVTVFLVSFLARGLSSAITVGGFGVIICGAYVTSKLAESITTLILYGRNSKQMEGDPI